MIKKDKNLNIIADIDLTPTKDEKENKRRKKIAIKRKKEEKESLKPQKGYIYIGYNKYTKLYKIGSTKNPELRFKHLNLSNGVEIVKILLSEKVIYYIQIENRTHNEFSNYKALGEWYKLSKKQIEKVKEYIINRIKNIENEIEMYGPTW